MRRSHDDANAPADAISRPGSASTPNQTQPHGFYDPDDTSLKPGTINLQRFVDRGKESFLMVSRIGYHDRELGDFEVPKRGTTLKTDFASIPQIFTWLVPRTGALLPAALLHDGLVPPSAQTYEGRTDLTRQQADRIFRDAMRDLGNGWIQRWLVWTAVAFATEWEAGVVDRTLGIRHRAVIVVRLAVFAAAIVVLGIMATLDLFDRATLVPWMGEKSLTYELLAGGIFAVVIPAALSLLFFGRHMVRAALILGIAMALLLHATILLVGLLLLYTSAESTISAIRRQARWRPAVRAWATLGITITGLLFLVKAGLDLDDTWSWSIDFGSVQDAADALDRLATRWWDLSIWFFLLPLIACFLVFVAARDKQKTPRGNARW